MDKVKQWMYYFIIGIVSLVALVFIPMLGSTVGLGWNIPNTMVGWIVWVATKIIVAVINVLIFYSFMQQAKINIKENEHYKEARDILAKQKVKNAVPRSPKKWNTQQYSIKGVTIFITTALATVALTQAILAYDWVNMLTYLFTIIMGLIFGVLQMKMAEDYWTDEYYRYALMVKEKNEKQIQEEVAKTVEVTSEECIKQRNDSICTNSGTNILESSNSNCDTSINYQPMILDSNYGYYSFLSGPVYAGSATTDSFGTDVKEIMTYNNKEKGEAAC